MSEEEEEEEEHASGLGGDVGRGPRGVQKVQSTRRCPQRHVLRCARCLEYRVHQVVLVERAGEQEARSCVCGVGGV